MIKTKTISVIMIVAMLISTFAIFGGVSQVNATKKIDYKPQIKYTGKASDKNHFNIGWYFDDKIKKIKDYKKLIVYFNIGGDWYKTNVKATAKKMKNRYFKDCIYRSVKIKFQNPDTKKYTKTSDPCTIYKKTVYQFLE